MKRVTINIENLVGTMEISNSKNSNPEAVAEQITKTLIEAVKAAEIHEEETSFFMSTDIKHHLDESFPNGVSKTEKTWKILGIVLRRKTLHYPKLARYDVCTNF